jgi:hypothetical protein
VAAIIGIVGKPKLVQEGRERLWWLRFFLDSLSDTLIWSPFANVEAVLQYRWLY